ncbi:hypothetical protein JCM6882_003104 [Rhodosporidiobolus microsporus]
MSDDNKRIDWHSMAWNDGDEIKKADGPTPLDHEASNKDTGLSEIQSTPVMYDYDEPGDSQPEHLTHSVWHNAMMHVDGHHNADETYDSMPHWQWIDDE